MKSKLILYTFIFVLVLITLSTCSQSSTENYSESGVDPAVINKGETIFQANCAACHMTTSEVVLVGPSMVGLVERAENKVQDLNAREYIHQSIVEPGAYINEGYQNLMPDTYGSILSEEDINALIAFLMTFD
jgi:cytochrome c2